MEERFYFCNSCGNLMIAAIASGVIPYCCGKEMTMLRPNTTDENSEKHVPVINFTSKHSMTVKIGARPHPMTGQHNIRFICLETDIGCIVRYLKENEMPEVCIRFNGKPVAVYAYCNVHGLWRADVPKCNTTCNTANECHVM